jgi:hypothetical protein
MQLRVGTIIYYIDPVGIMLGTVTEVWLDRRVRIDWDGGEWTHIYGDGPRYADFWSRVVTGCVPKVEG